MIAVKRLDKQLMYLNPDHITCIEETPDTVITLFNGNRYIVTDRATTIVSKVVAFRARISRRAASRSAKRYLARNNHSSCFMTDNTEQDEVLSSLQRHTPFYSRDY
ncbi:MAG: flagellar FlbD family protein [Desulfuromonadaceae bacterium]|nr:flagellar FlbD family protein [Desulfuromonadaceae bacterium]MDD2855735.1 flagellar FlbD family protein [Desulfuromonadaceae bacterium]